MPQELTEKSKAAVSKEIQDLSPSAIIELFVLQVSDTENLYFHAGTNELRQDIVWQGVTYSALPIQTTGFDISSQGTLPRPKLSIANIKGLFSALIHKFDDLIGMKIIRKRTFAKYLDAVNFANGNKDADPNIHFPDDIWYIDKKETENKLGIQWELASAFDLQGVKLPRRQVIQNYCQWVYRGPECGYTGPYFDINDEICTSKAADVCAKRLNSCKVRFQLIYNEEGHPVLPFGGFPGATRTNG